MFRFYINFRYIHSFVFQFRLGSLVSLPPFFLRGGRGGGGVIIFFIRNLIQNSDFTILQSIIFFVVQSSKLEEWLKNEDISNSLASLKEKKFADLDPTFHAKIDEDYDPKESGITRTSFCNVYLEWITFCVMRRKDKPRNLLASKDSPLVSLCLALSLLGKSPKNLNQLVLFF